MSTTASQPPLSDAPSYEHDPDVQLMLRAKAGEEAAFTQLVKNYQDRLVNIFFHLLQDQEAAEDLAQDVFLRIYRARHGYVPTARFGTWLFRIANNLASNVRRSKGRRKEVRFASGEATGPLAGPSESIVTEKSALMPTRQVDKQEMQRLVQEAISTLNERQRMAVLLHKFEDMSYQDIGEAMEMSPIAVKSLLARARENLRLALEPYMQLRKS